MMKVTLRAPQVEDWPGIHRVANESLPWAADENREWLDNRRRFARSGTAGRHYVAVDVDGEIIGFAALEGDAQPGRFRMFLVMSQARLCSDLGDRMADRLERDLSSMEARVVWVREEARDTVLLAFFRERGFAAEQRFMVGGTELVLLEKPVVFEIDPSRE